MASAFGVKPYKPAQTAPKLVTLPQPRRDFTDLNDRAHYSPALYGLGTVTQPSTSVPTYGQQPKAPAAGPAAPATSPQAPAGAAPAPDYAADPILARIQALGTPNIGGQVAQADAARKQLLIDLGDPGLARATEFGAPGLSLGALGPVGGFNVADTRRTGDEATALAAQQNPFSVFAQLGKRHEQRTADLNQQLAKANLFYSSTRGNALGEESNAYLGEQASARGSARSALAGIVAQILAAQQAELDRQVAAQTDAYQRYLASVKAAPAPPAAPPGEPPPPPPPPGGTSTPPPIFNPSATIPQAIESYIRALPALQAIRERSGRGFLA